jgi:hypothetical protein
MKLPLNTPLAILLLWTTLEIRAQNNPPPGCVTSLTNCVYFSGATNYGGVNYDYTNICVGGSITPPTLTSNVIYAPGAYGAIYYTDSCNNTNWSVRMPVAYNPGPLYWDPPIPSSFPACGLYYFTPKVNGIPSFGGCPTLINNVGWGGVGDVLTVVVCQAQVDAVDWSSDSTPFYNYNADYAGDGSNTFSRPVWYRSPATNNPVVQPQGQQVGLSVTINVCPQGLYYTLIGTSSSAGLCFTNTSVLATGTDQTVGVTASVPLRTSVDILSASIDWFILPQPQGTGYCCSAGRSGDHENYVTWASPITVNGNMTQKRINWACDTARGATTVDQAASAIHESLVNDFVLTNNCFDDAWYVLDGNGNPGYDCQSLSECMRYGVGALGISGSVAYAYAATNSTPPPSCTAMETRTCPGGIHGTEYLRIIDASEKLNDYEACCVVNSVWYPGGIHGSQSSALEVIRYWLDHGGKQAWTYGQDLQTCTNPGPFPVPRP